MTFHLLKRLLDYLKPYLSKVFLAIGFSVVVGAISTSPVPLIQKTFDDIFVNKDYFMLKVIPLILVGLYLIKGALLYAQNLIIFGISWDLVVGFRQKLFAHMQRLPFSFFEDHPTGLLISRIMNDVSIMQSTVTRHLKEFIQNGVMLLGLVGWLFYLKWEWALISLVIIPLTAVPVSNIARKLRRLSRRGQELLADISSTAIESFSGIKIVRAFGLEPQEREKFNRYNQKFLTVSKKNVKYGEIISPLLEFLGVVSAAVILWLGGTQVLTGQITQGTFIGFVVALFMMYNPLRLLFKIYANFHTSLAGAERVFAILDQPEEHLQEGTRELTDFRDRIEFREVTFQYPSRQVFVLKDINLTVNKSEVLAIVGMSGAGKTTLVDLLFRFYTVTRGRILIDGVDIREYTLKSLRRNLALVTQETFLFNDTIWNNIAFGREGASREEIQAAAEAAHVDFFVRHLDDGYDTVIGERGVKLSGGQRQRVAIARAIVRNAPILVLDEATSSLDSESEKLVQDALQNLMKQRTTFVIAHRLSTVKHADRILVMDGGEIVESGTHESLLAHSGLYQKYYEMQFIDVKNRNPEAEGLERDAI